MNAFDLVLEGMEIDSLFNNIPVFSNQGDVDHAFKVG